MRAPSHPRGTVSIEVLMALLPLLFVFLGVTQLALLKVGQMVVTHAANRAVRSAVVVLDDEPDHYGGVDRYDLDSGAARDQGGLMGGLGKANDQWSQIVQGSPVQGGARLTAIRQAAYHPLSVLAPSTLASGSVKDEVGGSPWLRVGLYSKVYNRAAAAITVTPTGKLGPRTPVTVKVNYLMRCGVPLVSRFMCVGGGQLLLARTGLLGTKKARHIMGEMAGVASPLLRDSELGFTGSRYQLLSAEATLPNQGASYHKD